MQPCDFVSIVSTADLKYVVDVIVMPATDDSRDPGGSLKTFPLQSIVLLPLVNQIVREASQNGQPDAEGDEHEPKAAAAVVGEADVARDF